MRAVLVGTLLTLIGLSPGQAFAWGDEGHKVIALIAYQHLAPNVRSQVDRMLAADPDTLTKPKIADAATSADKFRVFGVLRHPKAATPASMGPAKAHSLGSKTSGRLIVTTETIHEPFAV